MAQGVCVQHHGGPGFPGHHGPSFGLRGHHLALRVFAYVYACLGLLARPTELAAFKTDTIGLACMIAPVSALDVCGARLKNGWLDLVFVSKAVRLRCVLVMLVVVCAVTFVLSCMIASGKPRPELNSLRTHVNRLYTLQFAVWLHTTVYNVKRPCGMKA